MKAIILLLNRNVYLSSQRIPNKLSRQKSGRTLPPHNILDPQLEDKIADSRDESIYSAELAGPEGLQESRPRRLDQEMETREDIGHASLLQLPNFYMLA